MNALLFWPVLVAVLGVDVITKYVAEHTLSPAGIPTPVFGEVVRFTLVYNPGAAFGLYLGGYSRWIFLSLSIVAVLILFRMYQQTASGDWKRVGAISLVASGALGNLIDRVRSEYGVVDFIDVGVGLTRWPTFNVADMAVSTGAFLLAWVLWNEDQSAVPAVAGDAPADTAPRV